MKTLTAKRENFAQLVADGRTLTEAYREAYSSQASARVIAVEASRLAAMPKVAARITELRRLSTAERTLSRIQKRQILAAIAEGADRPAGARIAAIREDNLMTGDLAPSKNEVQVGPIDRLSALVASIRNRSPITAPAQSVALPDRAQVIYFDGVAQRREEPVVETSTIPPAVVPGQMSEYEGRLARNRELDEAGPVAKLNPSCPLLPRLPSPPREPDLARSSTAPFSS